MNRDLLVLFNQELLSPQAIEHEVELLHELLFVVERLDNLVTAHEILDLNKSSIFSYFPTHFHLTFPVGFSCSHVPLKYYYPPLKEIAFSYLTRKGKRNQQPQFFKAFPNP